MMNTWLYVCLLLAQLICGGRLQAQPAAESGAQEYERAVADGMQAFDRKQYTQARASFARAHQLRPSARTLRVLGLTDFALDDFSAAREELQAALAGQVEPVTPTQRAELNQLLGWMQDNLGRVQLTLEPDEAQAKIDGRPVAQHEVWLEPGTHRLLASAPGHHSLERSFTLELTPEPLLLREQLQPVSVPAPPLTATASEPDRLWLWLGSGGIACLAGGGVLLGLGLHESSRVEHQTSYVSADGIESRARRADWLTGLGIGLGVVGAAGVTAAVYSLLHAERARPAQSAWFHDVGPFALRVGRRF